MAVRAIRKPKKLKVEIAAYKRRLILEEACHLFFNQGYTTTTLDQVSERLNVTKPFIYSYYRNKGEILSEICQRGITLALDVQAEALAAKGTLTARMKLLVERTARIIIENQEFIVVYQREEKNLAPADARRIRDLRHRFDQKVAQLLEEGKKAGEFDIADPAMTAVWIGGLLSWISLWYNPEGQRTPSEVIRHALDAVERIVRFKPQKG
ncbi:MAG: TetR/AcrR family transcriptional regulator [Rhizomicrobium sp.]